MRLMRKMKRKPVLLEYLCYSVRPFRPLELRTLSGLFVLSIISVAPIAEASHRGIDMCEPIGVPMCVGMPYNMTRMPNHLHHSTQENARLAIEPYGELLKQNCSADLLFFLCAMFAPICTPQFQKEAIPPCRSVCERSRKGCEPLMNQYNFSWPDDLNCDLLPEYDKGVCVSPEAIVSSMPNNADQTTEKIVPERKINQNCTCKDRIKPSRTAYRKGKYDYAIAATVRRTTVLENNHTVILVTINSVLQRGKVHLQETKNIDLWANSSCVCPNLKIGRDYLIIGKEDVLLNKLKFNEKTLVTRWKTKWEKKFKKWKPNRGNRKKKKKNRKDCDNNGRCKKNRRKKVRCRVQQSTEHSKRLKCRQTTGGKRRGDRNRNALKRRDKNRRRNRNKTERNEVNSV